MTRILERSETGPLAIAKDSIEGTHIHLCRCGLSQSQPYCDGTHKITRQEQPNALFRYVREGPVLQARAVEVRDLESKTEATQ